MGSGRSKFALASIELSLPHRPATDAPHRPVSQPRRRHNRRPAPPKLPQRRHVHAGQGFRRCGSVAAWRISRNVGGCGGAGGCGGVADSGACCGIPPLRPQRCSPCRAMVPGKRCGVAARFRPARSSARPRPPPHRTPRPKPGPRGRARAAGWGWSSRPGDRPASDPRGPQSGPTRAPGPRPRWPPPRPGGPTSVDRRQNPRSLGVSQSKLP